MDPKCFILAVIAREGENPEVLHKTKDGWVSYMSRGMKARDPRSGRPKKNKKEAINNEELFQPLGFCMFLYVLWLSWLVVSLNRKGRFVDIVDKLVI